MIHRYFRVDQGFKSGYAVDDQRFVFVLASGYRRETRKKIIVGIACRKAGRAELLKPLVKSRLDEDRIRGLGRKRAFAYPVDPVGQDLGRSEFLFADDG